MAIRVGFAGFVTSVMAVCWPMQAPAAGAAELRSMPSIVDGLTPVTGDEEDAARPLPSIDLHVAFDTDSVRLTDTAKDRLQILAQALRDPRFGSSEFGIFGHTDAAGSAAYNMTLSERRADAVRNYLVIGLGLPAENLRAVGFGETRLKRPQSPRNAANRRVEIVNLTPERTREFLERQRVMPTNRMPNPSTDERSVSDDGLVPIR